jgi:hypothetical protein
MSEPAFKFRGIQKLQRNRDIERDGALLGIGDVTLLVRAATDVNPAWRQFGDDFRAELRRLARANASEDRTKKFLAESFARMFVIGWPDPPIDDDSGQPVLFSTEACVAWLMQGDDQIPAIQGMVYDTQNFRGQRIEAIVDTLTK